MKSDIERLLSIGSAPLCGHPPMLSAIVEQGSPNLSRQLIDLVLQERNGCFIFESALHIFPAGEIRSGYDLASWNGDSAWRSAFTTMAEGCLFFAEDVFGGQFAIRQESIGRFDPETGNFERISDTLDGWAGRILANYEVETGYPLAHEWQARHGPLKPNERLVPKLPFVLGGAFEIQNLQAMDAMVGMRLRAEIARQIHALPDGQPVRIRVPES
jgi:hypothetical protein